MHKKKEKQVWHTISLVGFQETAWFHSFFRTVEAYKELTKTEF